MEPNEIAALNYCSKEITSKVLVSANVLRKLYSRKMLSKKEEEKIKQIRDGEKQNSKLLEIIKKKPGGFKALTEALLLEKKANEHYVIKMRNQLRKLNCKQRVVPEDTTQDTHIRELEQKVKEYNYLSANMAGLVLGSSAKLDDDEENNINAMVNELEKTRQLLKMREKPLSDTFHACRMNSEQKVKTDLAQRYEKKKKDGMQKLILQQKEEIKKLKTKIEEIQNNHEEIIRGKVDVQVRERLVRLKLNDTTIGEPNPDQMESENDTLKEGCPVSHRTDPSTSTQPLPYGQPINYIQIENLNILQLNNDGNNIASTK